MCGTKPPLMVRSRMHPTRPSVSEVVSERCELTSRRRRTMLRIAGRTMRPPTGADPVVGMQ
jgi:hypothetical protein